jgi:hypothetical protein
MINISEKSFEQTIEDTLITGLPAKERSISETAPNFTNFIPGGWVQQERGHGLIRSRSVLAYFNALRGMGVIILKYRLTLI